MADKHNMADNPQEIRAWDQALEGVNRAVLAAMPNPQPMDEMIYHPEEDIHAAPVPAAFIPHPQFDLDAWGAYQAARRPDNHMYDVGHAIVAGVQILPLDQDVARLQAQLRADAERHQRQREAEAAIQARLLELHNLEVARRQYQEQQEAAERQRLAAARMAIEEDRRRQLQQAMLAAAQAAAGVANPPAEAGRQLLQAHARLQIEQARQALHPHHRHALEQAEDVIQRYLNRGVHAVGVLRDGGVLYFPEAHAVEAAERLAGQAAEARPWDLQEFQAGWQARILQHANAQHREVMDQQLGLRRRRDDNDDQDGAAGAGAGFLTKDEVAAYEAEREANETDPAIAAKRYARTCPVCYNPNPRIRATIVSCGHLVCRPCAVKVANMAFPAHTFACPVCRKESSTWIRAWETDDAVSEQPPAVSAQPAAAQQ